MRVTHSMRARMRTHAMAERQLDSGRRSGSQVILAPGGLECGQLHTGMWAGVYTDQACPMLRPCDQMRTQHTCTRNGTVINVEHIDSLITCVYRLSAAKHVHQQGEANKTVSIAMDQVHLYKGANRVAVLGWTLTYCKHGCRQSYGPGQPVSKGQKPVSPSTSLED
jgi:hypothetical protein